MFAYCANLIEVSDLNFSPTSYAINYGVYTNIDSIFLRMQ
jgi:hypothetical protein